MPSHRTTSEQPPPGDRDHTPCRLPDGRTMTSAEFGDPDGRPVVVVDGAGSRLQGRLADRLGRTHGIRVITPDRPSFHGSTPDPDVSFLRVADDLRSLYDHLGLAAPGLLALSGGTAFGCAMAFRHPDRVHVLGLLGPIAPIGEVGGTRGMDATSALAFRLGRRAPRLLAAVMSTVRWQTRRDLARAVDRFINLRPPADQAVMRRPDVRRILERSFPDVSQSPAGVAREFRLMTRPWGFDPAAIEVPTHVWGGEADSVHPPHHARWLAARISGATLQVRPGVGIFGWLDDYPDILGIVAPP